LHRVLEFTLAWFDATFLYLDDIPSDFRRKTIDRNALFPRNDANGWNTRSADWWIPFGEESIQQGSALTPHHTDFSIRYNGDRQTGRDTVDTDCSGILQGYPSTNWTVAEDFIFFWKSHP